MSLKHLCCFELCLFFGGALSCGPAGRGKAFIPNDLAPDGTVVAQGQFTGLNSKSVTGVAVIYKLSQSGSYIVRLEGISAPAESGLEVHAAVSSGTVLKAILINSQGTQNYSVNVAGEPTWVSVSIYSTPKGYDYGKAILSLSSNQFEY